MFLIDEDILRWSFYLVGSVTWFDKHPNGQKNAILLLHSLHRLFCHCVFFCSSRLQTFTTFSDQKSHIAIDSVESVISNSKIIFYVKALRIFFSIYLDVPWLPYLAHRDASHVTDQMFKDPIKCLCCSSIIVKVLSTNFEHPLHKMKV
jgi:hypothetical protein